MRDRDDIGSLSDANHRLIADTEVGLTQNAVRLAKFGPVNQAVSELGAARRWRRLFVPMFSILGLGVGWLVLLVRPVRDDPPVTTALDTIGGSLLFLALGGLAITVTRLVTHVDEKEDAVVVRQIEVLEAEAEANRAQYEALCLRLDQIAVQRSGVSRA